MRTRYGDIGDELFSKYLDKLIGKVFKLLPLKEEGNQTIGVYHNSLMLELVGGKNLIIEIKDNPEYLSLLMSLESLNYIDDLDLYKRKVFECIDIIKKLKG